jgi:hypothetical protein
VGLVTHHAIFTLQEQADLSAIAQWYLDTTLDIVDDPTAPAPHIEARRKLAQHVIDAAAGNLLTD